MSSYHDILLQHVVPGFGVITGTFLTFAPYRAVLHASREGHLGHLNPTPWAVMLGKCIGWTTYAIMLGNYYVFIPNAIGYVLAIWLNVQAIKLHYENYRSGEMQTALIAALEEHSQKTFHRQELEDIVEKVLVAEDGIPTDMIWPISSAPTFTSNMDESDTENAHGDDLEGLSNDAASATEEDEEKAEDDGITSVFDGAAEAIVDFSALVWDVAAQKSPAPASHELLVIVISVVWLILIAVVSLGRSFLSENARLLTIGIAANLNLVFFYGAPLSSFATVIKTKSSNVIHVSTMVTTLLNGMFWFSYGIAIGNGFVYVPNGIGAFLGAIQFLLCLIFPRESSTRKRRVSWKVFM
jgi:solute carrier family 50 protein (sugar transporter)